MNPQPIASDSPLIRTDKTLEVDDVERLKRYDCTGYDDCLSIAFRAGWTQFHCNDCSAYVALPDDHHARRLFARAGAVLLAQEQHNSEQLEVQARAHVEQVDAAERARIDAILDGEQTATEAELAAILRKRGRRVVVTDPIERTRLKTLRRHAARAEARARVTTLPGTTLRVDSLSEDAKRLGPIARLLTGKLRVRIDGEE